MKVNVDKTEEVSDTQRVQIANVIDGKVSKRQATRDELKQYIWDEGSGWEIVLREAYEELTGESSSSDEDEDLIGDLVGEEESDPMEDLL